MHTAKNTFGRVGLAISILCSGMVLAADVEVGTCRSGFQQYATIQDAVNAASSGEEVLICPGIYPEQVVINKSLELRGLETKSASGAVISAPSGGVAANSTSLLTGNPIAAQVLVQNASDVDIRNLTVDGTNNGLASCSPIFIGIFYQNASGKISHIAALNQSLASGQTGCQSGLAIFAQSGSGGSSDVRVENTVVQGYQKNGITGNEAGTSITITENSVSGQGPTTGAAENGIQVGFGATGRVTRNTVIDNIWAPATITGGAASAGILIYASSGVAVHDNVIGDNQLGIDIVTDPTSGAADENQVTWNRISATHVLDGIDVCSNNNTIHDNKITRADESGIRLDSRCTNSDGSATGKGNRVRENVVNSSCAGILVGTLTAPSANFILDNDLFNVIHRLLTGDQCPLPLATPLANLRATATAGIAQGGLNASPVRP